MSSNHNSMRWLAVKWLPTAGGRRIRPRLAGWYVVRICRCHPNQPVTMPLATEKHAISAMRAMLETSRKLGT